MSRPPRNPQEPLFGHRTLALSLLQGVSVLIIILAVFGIALHRGLGELEARALAFTTLIIANLSLILTNRSWSRTILKNLLSPNRALWWVLGGAVAFVGIILYVPFMRSLFRLSVLHPLDLFICLSAGFVSIIWFEGLKMFNGRRKQPSRPSRA